MRLIWNGSFANVTFNLTCASHAFFAYLYFSHSVSSNVRENVFFCLTFHFLLMFCVFFGNELFLLLLLNFLLSSRSFGAKCEQHQGLLFLTRLCNVFLLCFVFILANIKELLIYDMIKIN